MEGKVQILFTIFLIIWIVVGIVILIAGIIGIFAVMQIAQTVSGFGPTSGGSPFGGLSGFG